MRRRGRPAFLVLLTAFAVPAAGQQISIGDVALQEGDAGQTMAVFDVTFSPPGGGADGVTFEFMTRDGTATAGGADYTAVQGVLAFPAGEDIVQVTVPVNGDLAEEPDEEFFVDIFNAMPTDVLIVDSEGRGTILNDDVPMVSIDDVAVSEGDAGQIDALFMLTVSEAIPAGPITVDFATRDGTATTADGDYDATSGQLTIPTGAISGAVGVVVKVNGDTTPEADEEFFLDLTDATGAGIADGEGRGTIQNDDQATLSIGDAELDEGDSGERNAVLVVTLSTPSALPVTVRFATRDGSATVAGDDYRPRSGQLGFAPGETRRRIRVPIRGDTRVEPDEQLAVDLRSPVGATLADAEGVVTIRNDDAAPGVIRLIGPPEIGEGAGNAIVTVERAGGGTGAATVDFATADGTAVAGRDYRAAAGTLSWGDGETGARTFEIEILEDNLEEEDETLSIGLSGVTGATLGEPSRLTLAIVDDDAPSRLEPVGDTRVSTKVDLQIEVRVVASREDGAPVQGARVFWTVEGDAELTGGNPTLTDADGLAGQQLVLGGSPGVVTVSAEIAATGQTVSFEIVVGGDLDELFDPLLDPAQASLAEALNNACLGARQEFGELCDYLFGLEPAQQREVIAELTPTEAGALADLLLQSPLAQLLNLRRHLAARRGGGGSGSQIALNLTGRSVPLEVLKQALAGEVEIVQRMAARIEAAMFERGEEEAAAVERPPESDEESRFSFFASGQVDIGDRPGSELEAGYDLETLGLTIGLDYRVGPRVVIGGALGYVDTDTEVAGDGGGIDARGYSLSGFVTYFRDRFWLDGIVSYGRTEYDFVRNVDLPQPFQGRARLVASGRPEGAQLAVDAGAGYDASFGAASLTGFGRLSYIDADVDAFTEEGVGPFGLSLRSQEIESLLLEAGLEVVWAASRPWGVLQPVLRASALHEFEDDSRVVVASFAADPGDNQFRLPTDRPDRDFLRLGAGLTATLARGRAFYLLYETDLAREDFDLYRLSGGVRLEF